VGAVAQRADGRHPAVTTGRFGERPDGHADRMTVTDPDVPDPLNDPRTLQADPGASGQGADLASAEDDPEATGAEELAAGRTDEDDAGGDVTGGDFSERPPA
jgi:hypothetical protein